jgi:iron complex outermembrane receptor protein
LNAILLGLAAAAVAQQTPGTSANTAVAVENATKPKITTTESVVVTAPGEFRVEQSIEPTQLIEEMPGTSPVKSLAALPSVNFQAADPYGSYEWAVRISVRGFNQNQLGFTLDDIPLGDMSYGNWNGLHISRAITDENIGRMVLSQGTGALETASTSDLGGTIQFYSDEPRDKRNITLNQSFGSYAAYRTFARFDSGLFPNHTKFFLSGAYNLADKWRGQGQIGQNYWQLNGKLVHYMGANGVLSIYADVSDRREVDYQDVSKIWVQQLGYSWDNYGNWANSVKAGWATEAAYAATGGNTCGVSGVSASVYGFPAPVGSLDSANDPCDAAYYAGAGLRKDQIGAVTYKQAIGDHWTLKLIGYGHHDDGRGLWFSNYQPTYDNYYSPTTILSPIALRTSEYGINRGGFIGSAAYESGRNKVEFGFWFEGERWDLARRYYATSTAGPMHSLYSFPSNPFTTVWEYVFNTTVYDMHIQDVYKVNEKLTLAAGFKTEETTTDGELSKTFLASYGVTPSGYGQGQLTSGKPVLPQFGANYKLDHQNEIFGDAAYNVRSYVPGGFGFSNSPWGVQSKSSTITTQQAFNALKKSLKPETSWTEEIGYRYTGHHASMQASYFHVNFFDRLLAFSNGSGIQGKASELSNVPGVTTNGIDGSVSYRITPEVTFYGAATWNRSTYDGDPKDSSGNCVYTLSSGACDSIIGKIALDTPEFLYKNSLEYSKHGFFSKLGADYMSTRYFTYSNDGSVDGRWLADFGAGYNREDLGAFKNFKAQFNISNLTGEKYFGAIDTNGVTLHDPLALNYNTLQVGAPRSISGTLSINF